MSIVVKHFALDKGINIHYSEYTNETVLFISQVNKLGVVVQAVADNPEEDVSSRVYTVDTLFGERDEWNEVLARRLVEELQYPSLVIVISVVEKTKDVFDSIIRTMVNG